MANYQIFRVAKVKRQGVGGCQQEHNRTEKDVGRFPDSEIDYGKTSQNKYLVKSENYWEDIKKELQKHGIESYRKDAVVMNDAIYTMSPEAMKKMTEENRQQYFSECLEWHKEHFGPVINAVIHYDETTIHMHVDSVPIVKKEDGTFKLSAKDQYGNRTHMAMLQTDLHQKVTQYYSLERGNSRIPEEQRKHKTKLEHDIKQVEKAKEKIMTNAKAEIAQKTKEAEAESQKQIELSREQAETFKKGAERRLEEMQEIEIELNRKKGELGEIRAQELAMKNEIPKYKKSTIHKDCYIVPIDDMNAVWNIGTEKRQLNKKKLENEEKEKQLKVREQKCKNMELQFDKYPELVRQVRQKESRLQEQIEEAVKDAVREVTEKYQTAMKSAGVYQDVMQQMKSMEKVKSHGYTR